MGIYKNKLLIGILLIAISSFTTVSYALNNSSVEFFYSNNTQVIDLEKAYERLTSDAQHELKNMSIDVMQIHHIEQGRFKKILGTYQMDKDKSVTGDSRDQVEANILHAILEPHYLRFLQFKATDIPLLKATLQHVLNIHDDPAAKLQILNLQITSNI